MLKISNRGWYLINLEQRLPMEKGVFRIRELKNIVTKKMMVHPSIEGGNKIWVVKAGKILKNLNR